MSACQLHGEHTASTATRESPASRQAAYRKGTAASLVKLLTAADVSQGTSYGLILHGIVTEMLKSRVARACVRSAPCLHSLPAGAPSGACGTSAPTGSLRITTLPVSLCHAFSRCMLGACEDCMHSILAAWAHTLPGRKGAPPIASEQLDNAAHACDSTLPRQDSMMSSAAAAPSTLMPM